MSLGALLYLFSLSSQFKGSSGLCPVAFPEVLLSFESNDPVASNLVGELHVSVNLFSGSVNRILAIAPS